LRSTRRRTVKRLEASALGLKLRRNAQCLGPLGWAGTLGRLRELLWAGPSKE